VSPDRPLVDFRRSAGHNQRALNFDPARASPPRAAVMPRTPRRWRTASAASLLGLLLVGQAVAAERPEVAGGRLGLGDRYKLGCWAPLRVSVEGGDEPLAVGVVAVAPDSDGVGVATTTPGGRPLSTEPGRTSVESLYVRVGQLGATVQTQLLADGRVIGRRSFDVDHGGGPPNGSGDRLSQPVSSFDRLYLQIGPGSAADDAWMLRDLESLEGYQSNTQAAFVSDLAELPRDAIGYDSFDTVVLVAGAGGDPASGGWLGDLSAGDPRLRALVSWVESGGRLVLSCGAAGEALLGPGGPLADLAPGEYAGPGSLSVTDAIRRYADPPEDTPAIEVLGGSLPLSKVTDPEGVVEAFGGRDRGEAPLVVRTPRGFGEVTFVAFDLDAPEIAAWRGRSALVRRLLELPRTDDRSGQSFAGGYGQDFVNRLIERLDTSFSGVRTAPFLLIVGLVVVYLLLIGPGDYFFVKNVLKRVEATWITFPLIVAVTSAAAYAGAYWLKGSVLRVNQVEIVDIDAATGRLRGTLLTHVFSPRADRYDLGLAAQTLAGEPLQPTDASTAWLGKPGWGLGGMQSYGAGVRSAEYRLDPTPLVGGGAAGPSVLGLPIQVWSTKTLVSRYTGESDHTVEARLTPDGDGLVDGSITNDSGAELTDCRLLYGTWAWRLGTLGDGETVAVDQSRDLVRVSTLLADARGGAAPDSIDALATIASVGQAATGSAVLASRYLGYLDLTHHLQSGDALLLARVEDGPRSELLTGEGEPLVDLEEEKPDEPVRKSWVFARFVLPVREE